MVEFLVRYGAELAVRDKDDRTIHLVAASDLPVVKVLIAKGDGTKVHLPPKDGLTPLCAAARDGNVDVVKFLIAKGATVDLRTADSEGRAPILMASLHGHSEVLQCLLSHKGDFDVDTQGMSSTGQKILHSAASQGHLHVVRYLSEHIIGANLNIRDHHGWTPLASAADNGQLESVKYLLERNHVDLHAASDEGWTPLSSAADSGHIEVVKYLFEHGADVDLHDKNNNG
ncbi:Ankyrin repeat-containing protein 23 [Elsinoe fawcettii]|nr:Ankyrin repeat-containing protein 23 [Elsinoe fawcettii]